MNIIKPAKRTENITYAIRDLVVEADKIRALGKKVLNLNIGDPNTFDFVTPGHMIEAVHKAMLANKNGYANSMGLDEARESVVNWAARKGIQTTKENVIITSGLSEAIEMCFAGLMNSGENILTPTPGYPLYISMINKFQGVLNQYMCSETNQWQPDIDDMKKKIGPKTRGIVVINPNNPTGALYGKKVLREIIELANEHDLIIFSDEVYDRIIFDGETHISTASLAGNVPVITLNGLSKNYLAPGWRIGWMAFSGDQKKFVEYREAIAKLARARLSSSYPMQFAVKPALEGSQEHIPGTVKKLQERRDIVFRKMNELEGFHLTKPKGAFYAFPGFDLPVKDDREFVLGILREKGVLVVHGTGFGWNKPDHFRVVTLAPTKELAEACDRIGEYAKEKFGNRKMAKK